MKQLNRINYFQGRRPRFSVLFGTGTNAPSHSLVALLDMEVVNNNFYEADTFQVRAVLSAQKAPHNGAAWWLSQPEIMVSITVGTEPSGSVQGSGTTLIVGRVDDVVVDPVADEIILSGRDLTGLLIDSRTSGDAMQQYQNSTASQIVEGLLAPFSSWFSGNNIQPTTQQVGHYAGGNFLYLFRNRSVWDVIVWLAQTNVGSGGSPDPFVAYVDGFSLNFGPAPTPTGYFLIEWSPSASTSKTAYPMANVTHLDIAHNLTLAKDVSVTVMGFNPTIGRYSATASGKHAQGHTGGGSFSQSLYSSVGYQHFVFVQNGITPIQAQQMAQAKAKALSQHEYILRVTMPGDPTLDPTQIVRFKSPLLPNNEMDFWVNAVTWRLNESKGFEMELWLKNHPTGQQVVL